MSSRIWSEKQLHHWATRVVHWILNAMNHINKKIWNKVMIQLKPLYNHPPFPDILMNIEKDTPLPHYLPVDAMAKMTWQELVAKETPQATFSDMTSVIASCCCSIAAQTNHRKTLLRYYSGLAQLVDPRLPPEIFREILNKTTESHSTDCKFEFHHRRDWFFGTGL